jgi:hypothetical protein
LDFHCAGLYDTFAEKLEAKKMEEQESKFFTEMPCQHFMVVTQQLLQW